MPAEHVRVQVPVGVRSARLLPAEPACVAETDEEVRRRGCADTRRDLFPLKCSSSVSVI